MKFRAMRPRPRPSRLLPVISALLVLPWGSSGLALADDVYLANGQVFEDVETREVGDRLVIQLEIGRLTLAKSDVVEIVERALPLESFLDRRKVLQDDPQPNAASWLELARFARSHSLDEAHRSAVLMASRIDPTHPGLAVPMRGLGYVLADDGVEWLPEAEVMRRRGLVRYEGEWLDPLEARRRVSELETTRQDEEAWRERRAAHESPAALPRSSTSTEDVALAQVELMRDLVETVANDRDQQTTSRPVTQPVVQSGFYPGYFVGFSSPRPADAAGWDAMARRQPGSIIPVSAFRSKP